MSYLSALRLHFAGQFQASVSTVNNDPTHYDNATFKPEYRLRQTATSANGWWNPDGDADWRLIGCRVTSALLPDGPAAPDDPVLACLIADSDRQPPAKLVDIDPEQQLVSTIWGLEVRIADTSGATLVRGQYVPAAFMDIWDRLPTASGDGLAGAMYQSVLTDLEWGDVSRSPFLQQLQAAASDGLLSIKFNVDSYVADYTDPDFTRGRIVGTIGLATTDEPRHFVAGRQFMTAGSPSGHFFGPAGGVNVCVAAVDAGRGKVCLDLGNALPLASANGPFSNLGDIRLTCRVQASGTAGTPSTLAIDTLAAATYTDPGWYPRTAGVVELPADRALTDAELEIVQNNPLAISTTGTSGAPPGGIDESPGGVFVRADDHVFRLNPGEQVDVEVIATRYGQHYVGATVLAELDPSQLQGPPPPVGTPTSAISVPAQVVTDRAGRATLTIGGSDPGNPRGYIDGQVYGVRPILQETANDPSYPFNPWLFITVLVWDAFQAHDPPTWHDDLQPIFQQNRNLYPVMDAFLDLADPASVWANRGLLKFAFGHDPSNPNAMPVTRDLSAAKRKAILDWLSAPEPVLGTPRPLAAVSADIREAEQVPHQIAIRGGKAAAAARRQGLRAPAR